MRPLPGPLLGPLEVDNLELHCSPGVRLQVGEDKVLARKVLQNKFFTYIRFFAQ